jgi:hypothetical protein
MLPRVSSIAGVLALLATARTASAQANYHSSPIGGRSALMGGTGVALARDGAAPFLNPATILNIDDSGVAFSVNFYTAQWTTLSAFHQPGAVDTARYGQLSLPDTSLSGSHADALPSTLCLFLTIGHWGDNAPEADPVPGHRVGRRKLAACLGTLERLNVSATAAGYSGSSGTLTANQAASVQQAWQRVYVGPTYGQYVTDDVAIGGSLDGVVTTASSQWDVDTLIHEGTAPSLSSTYDTATSGYSVDLAAQLGLTWHIDSSQVLGVSVSSPSLHMVGNLNATDGLQVGSRAQLATSTGSFSAPTPVRLAVGLGSVGRRVRVESDASLYVPVTYLEHSDLQTTQTAAGATSTTSTRGPTSLEVNGRPLVDAAVGLETFLSPRLSLLTGASLDLSPLGPLPLHPSIGTLEQTRMQRAALAIGVGSYGDGSELLFGTELSYAWGQSLAFDPFEATPGLTVVDQRTFGIMFIIAGSASISAFRRTLRDLGDVVRLPAR